LLLPQQFCLFLLILAMRLVLLLPGLISFSIGSLNFLLQ
jgi:hypothetical protein